MFYRDLVYGQVEITEPVVLEIFNSPWLKRLRDVDQGGYPPLFAKPGAKLIKSEHNRFAHSVGVYLLLNKYGAPIAEQIAGLIHDVSHSVFSHCIDYALPGGNGKAQDHQDNLHNNFISKTDLPVILKKYGFVLEYILDDENFPLKEKSIPDLCADRIDYLLREGIIFEEISVAATQEILKSLTVENKNWVFNNFLSAKKYAELFFTLNNHHFADLPTAVMFLSVGNLLKYALEKKYLNFDDLYTTDNQVLEKIKEFAERDDHLKLLWRRMNDPNSVIAGDETDHDAEIFCKSRIVDPLFKDGGRVKRLSEREPAWREVVKRELTPKRYLLKYNY